jgi:hypothetical protein
MNADSCDSHAAAGEARRPSMASRGRVPLGLRLEQRQASVGAVGGPHGRHSPVVLAECEGSRLVSAI